MTLVVSKMYLIKSTKKPLYYGIFNEYKHKTNIIYFTKEEDSKKIAKYVSNYYSVHKKAPRFEEIDLEKQINTQTDYFKSQIVDENYFKFMIKNTNIDMCQCNISNNKIKLNYIEYELDNVTDAKINLNLLYMKEYDKRIFD